MSNCPLPVPLHTAISQESAGAPLLQYCWLPTVNSASANKANPSLISQFRAATLPGCFDMPAP